MPPHPADISRVISLIGEAKRVIIMAGLGAVRSGARQECQALAERLGGLLSTTLPARGLFSDEPFNLCIAGGFSSDVTRECFAQADLIIAVGTSLAHHNSFGGKLFSADKVIQIDTTPSAISQGRSSARFHLRADAKLGVAALVEALGPASGESFIWRTPELATRIKNTPPDSTVFPQEPGLLDPRQVVKALDAALPHEWEMVNSSGHCSYFFAHMPDRPVEKFHTIREFGAIGNGIAFAMGVATARPENTVVLFDGDGSLLMHVQELETMLRHQMNILICVLNDGAYGSEIHKLRAEGLSEEGAVFGRPDLGRIARGFGLSGQVVNDLNKIPDLLEEFMQKGGTCIWDFHISDQIISPVMRSMHPTK